MRASGATSRLRDLFPCFAGVGRLGKRFCAIAPAGWRWPPEPEGFLRPALAGFSVPFDVCDSRGFTPSRRPLRGSDARSADGEASRADAGRQAAQGEEALDFVASVADLDEGVGLPSFGTDTVGAAGCDQDSCVLPEINGDVRARETGAAVRDPDGSLSGLDAVGVRVDAAVLKTLMSGRGHSPRSMKLKLTTAGPDPWCGAVCGIGVLLGVWNEWRKNRTFSFSGPGARSKTVPSPWVPRPGVFPAADRLTENVEKIETLQAACGRVQAIANPTSALAATRLLSTIVQQELDHE